MILGSGPNRIGQGIEFDYCCCHASFALQEFGVESIMVNCNPETVSTDYDTSDRLYFEPLTLEDVLNIVDTEKPDGVIVQFGGQTPLNLALPLKRLGRADHRHRSREHRPGRRPQAASASCSTICRFPSPANGTATSVEEAVRRRARASAIPVLVRPSYVLGGRAMVIAYDEETVRQYMREAVTFSQDRPVLIDRFLEDATEVDVDALCDGEDVLIAGIMEHIEEAGVHSGDSSCVLPPHSLAEAELDTIEDYTVQLAMALNVIGLMNVQYAIKDGTVYVLEVNPRASRTVPYVSKATGVPLPKIAVGLMLGQEADGFERHDRRHGRRRAAGAAVLREVARVPVQQIPRRGSGARAGDALHRRSDGRRRELRRGVREGADQRRHAAARTRARSSSASTIATRPRRSKSRKRFAELGFELVATRGTAAAIASAGLHVQDRLQGERRPAQRSRSAEGRLASSWSSTRRPARPRSTTRRRSAAPRSRTASPASRR